MSYTNLKAISEALGKLLEKGTEYNVIIRVGQEPNFKEFRAHSNILGCRSEYFDRIFSPELAPEKEDGIYIIKKPNISPETFDAILKYLYTGHINLDNKTGTELVNIATASSDEFDEYKLSRIIENFIIEDQYQLLNDPVDTIIKINYNQRLNNLKECCLEIICFKPEILFNSDKFNNLSNDELEISILKTIIKRDDLNLTEIDIWDYLIKWGLKKLKVNNNNNNDNNDNNNNVPTIDIKSIGILKRHLQQFIPLIRFGEISYEDYSFKIKPYENIFSKEKRNEILRTYMMPGYRPVYTLRQVKCYNHINVDSIIINRKHVAIFSNWIDRKKRHIKDIPHKLNLLYRASNDGYTNEAFHQKCDDKGPSIIVIKIKNSKRIIGGYNPCGWDSKNRCKAAFDSFIFTFSNNSNIQTAKVRYSRGGPYSIVCYSHIFGYNDLYNCEGKWTGSNPTSYPKLEGMPSGKIDVEDYEVFQVVNIAKVLRRTSTSATNRTSRIRSTIERGYDKDSNNEVVNILDINENERKRYSFFKSLFGKK